MPSQFYVRQQDKVMGPVAGIKLKQAVAAGTVLPTDQVSDSPDGPWHFVADVPPLNTPPTPESDPVESQQRLQQEEAARRQSLEEEAWQSVERELTTSQSTDAPSATELSSGISRHGDFRPNQVGILARLFSGVFALLVVWAGVSKGWKLMKIAITGVDEDQELKFSETTWFLVVILGGLIAGMLVLAIISRWF